MFQFQSHKLNRLYCIVLYWWSGHCCQMHCDLFQFFRDPPNLGITRTWIWQLNFAQRPIFSGLRFFNEPDISDFGTPSLKSLLEDLWSGFLRPEKIHWPHPSLNPQTLELEASTLPRDHRGRRVQVILYLILMWLSKWLTITCHSAVWHIINEVRSLKSDDIYMEILLFIVLLILFIYFVCQ